VIGCQTLNNFTSVLTSNNFIKISTKSALIISSIYFGLCALTQIATRAVILAVVLIYSTVITSADSVSFIRSCTSTQDASERRPLDVVQELIGIASGLCAVVHCYGVGGFIIEGFDFGGEGESNVGVLS